MSVPNQHEAYHREQKCRKVVRQVIAEAAAVLSKADDTVWDELARRAEVNRPSEESRKRIVQILEDMAR